MAVTYAPFGGRCTAMNDYEQQDAATAALNAQFAQLANAQGASLAAQRGMADVGQSFAMQALDKEYGLRDKYRQGGLDYINFNELGGRDLAAAQNQVGITNAGTEQQIAGARGEMVSPALQALREQFAADPQSLSDAGLALVTGQDMAGNRLKKDALDAKSKQFEREIALRERELENRMGQPSQSDLARQGALLDTANSLLDDRLKNSDKAGVEELVAAITAYQSTGDITGLTAAINKYVPALAAIDNMGPLEAPAIANATIGALLASKPQVEQVARAMVDGGVGPYIDELSQAMPGVPRHVVIRQVREHIRSQHPDVIKKITEEEKERYWSGEKYQDMQASSTDPGRNKWVNERAVEDIVKNAFGMRNAYGKDR